MDFQTWYDKLQKPSWTPSPDTIGMIWTIIYPIIFVVNVIVLVKLRQKAFSWKVALPFWLNLAFNLAFTPVQFGLRNLLLATIVIVLVWATTLWSMIAIWPYNKWLALAFGPYLLWVTLASILQVSIFLANR